MWTYEKKLEYPINIKNPNPAIAKFIISQVGGPDGELGASQRYLSQRYSMPFNEAVATLTDVGAEAPVCSKRGTHVLFSGSVKLQRAGKNASLT